MKGVLLLAFGVSLGAQPYNPIPPALPVGTLAIAGFGDSLTAGTGCLTSQTNCTYPSQLTGLLGQYVYNGGVGGQTSTQIATRYLADTTHRGYFLVIEAGRNNFSAQSTVLADVASMVAVLPWPRRFVVLAVPNSNVSNEWSGATGYNQIISLDTAFSSTYPADYIDTRAAVVAAYNSGNAEDVIDHGHDVAPSTLRAQDASGTLNGAISDAVTCTINLTGAAGTLAVTAGYTVLVDSEKIYVSAASSGNITGCTRGYAGTTATTHLTSTAYTGTDPLHLNAAGYLVMAQQIQTYLAAHLSSNYAVGVNDLKSVLQTNPPITNLPVPVRIGDTNAAATNVDVVGPTSVTLTGGFKGTGFLNQILRGPALQTGELAGLDFVSPFDATAPVGRLAAQWKSGTGSSLWMGTSNNSANGITVGAYIDQNGSLGIPYAQGIKADAASLLSGTTLTNPYILLTGFSTTDFLNLAAPNAGGGASSPTGGITILGTHVLINSGGSAGKATCFKADGKTLGFCSTTVDATGACTCN